jgi:hypothetical protein
VAKSYPNHPNVVPFGYGQASPQFLSDVATLPDGAFLAKDGGTGGALKKVIPALLNTLIASASDNALSVPTEVDGYTRVSSGIIDDLTPWAGYESTRSARRTTADPPAVSPGSEPLARPPTRGAPAAIPGSGSGRVYRIAVGCLRRRRA